MPEFFTLPAAEQLEALNIAASASGRQPHLLEKDIWVVWALQHLFTGPHADHLVFKGGSSLSKAYGVIQRLSEDVDFTYDHGPSPATRLRTYPCWRSLKLCRK